jgi:hypothetical protein
MVGAPVDIFFLEGSGFFLAGRGGVLRLRSRSTYQEFNPRVCQRKASRFLWTTVMG